MKSAFGLIFALLGSAVCADIDVPSGLDVALYDVVMEPDTNTARFLFVAPALSPDGAGVTFTEVEADFPYICENLVLPALASNNWHDANVIISLADREVPFGILTPDATQFFEMYQVQDNTCIWEGL